MRCYVISLFPEMFDALRMQGVAGRACEQGIWSLTVWNPRDYTHDVHRTVDDRPYGGGPGMVMMAEPLEKAVQAASEQRVAVGGDTSQTPVVLMSPTGRRFDQARAERFLGTGGAILICGRYEGIDQRFIDRCVTEEISLGDFVLSGGEIPAMAVIDSSVRLLEGVLKEAQSDLQDSFQIGRAWGWEGVCR